MFLYVCVYVYICIFVCVCVCAYMYFCVYVCIHPCIYLLCTYGYIDMYTYIYVCMCVYACIYIHLYIELFFHYPPISCLTVFFFIFLVSGKIKEWGNFLKVFILICFTSIWALLFFILNIFFAFCFPSVTFVCIKSQTLKNWHILGKTFFIRVMTLKCS